MPALISQDGRWWWDGRAWRSRLVDGPLDLFWFTGTPEWFERIALIGLISIIPFVGAINLYGWTLVAADMVRRRWRELPPAGFQYLERGVAPFVVLFLYGIAALVVTAGFIAVTVIVFASGHVVAGIVATLLVVLLWIGYGLASLYCLAALLVVSDRLGMARALNPLTLVRLANRNRSVSLSVALTYFVAELALIAAGSVIPFAGIAAVVALPAVYALIVPRLAEFEVVPNA